ncbi:thiol reductase thioredoxin, partial [Armatimonadetes bacterium]|nr:thiol reductase thioredoxin [bacterium]
DEESELASQFRVMSIPTLMVMKDGKVSATAVGVRPKKDILRMLEA